VFLDDREDDRESEPGPALFGAAAYERYTEIFLNLLRESPTGIADRYGNARFFPVRFDGEFNRTVTILQRLTGVFYEIDDRLLEQRPLTPDRW